MNLKSQIFVQNLFKDYYKHGYDPKVFPEIERREFGFLSFEGFMLRHKSFSRIDDLKRFLESSTPMDAYYSCAYYENPEAEMDKKGWLGADLIFDIDADHIPTSCNKIHDEWTCGDCNFSGKGLTPEKCPICNGEKFSVVTWPCEICLNAAKMEIIKLLDMLMSDFGFSDKEVQVFFSGHRGYHVQIESETVKGLDANARKEIVDYVTCLGFEVMPRHKSKGRMETRIIFERNTYGWSRRLNTELKNLILKADEEDFRKIGLKQNIARKLAQNKDRLLKNWIDSGAWGGVAGVGLETFRKIAEYAVQMKSAKIDSVVTTDIHRLIRLPETLHGKTGFKKTWLSTKEIEDFDPFTKATAFKKGTVILQVSDAPRFRLNGETFGPFKNQKVELPISAAVLLICKNKAEVLE
ncbi:MAG: DNA primase small subunit PriS [Nitrososphaerota archaeon]|nr:DNA primase small subunit PriS [Candidatus Bathyarchaeota archaeon]MDW8023308.1 DNA primase small subunit PriS [Nitrososphaerota archaeon]